MKTNLLLVIMLLAASSVLFSQNPHFTRNKEGILVMGKLDWSLSDTVFQQAKQMGVDILWDRVEHIDNNLSRVINNNMNIMPISVRDNTNVRFNWIEYYCDAKYTVWEAEGTDVVNVGRAKLERDLKRTEVIPGEGIVRIKPEYAGSVVDSMIYGPYYYQEKNYIAYMDTVRGVEDTLVRYEAKFRLMLQRNYAYQNLDTLNENMDTVICKLLITYSKIKCCEWGIESTTTIDSLILKRRDFPILNNFIDKIINYDLGNVPHGGNPTSSYHRINNVVGIEGGINGPENIEFKVVWLGNPNYLLSVDKIIVSDERGRQILVPFGIARTRILDQLNLLLPSYQNVIVGWWGIDEPYSIDNFYPIGIVAQILREYQPPQQLYLPFMGAWDGVYNDSTNPFGTNKLSRWYEFSKRTNGLVNILQNAYFYDTPFSNERPIIWRLWEYGYRDFRDANIYIASRNYQLAREIDSLFGVTLQSSAQTSYYANLRDPTPIELLYSTNLALMHGAKYFDFYTYFPTQGFTSTGIINSAGSPTPKWFMWKDIIEPRLAGNLGKKIKTLTASQQHLSFDIVNSSPIINRNFISEIHSLDMPTEADQCILDIGFFNERLDSTNKKYFMLLNRYYSTHERLHIKLRYLSNFRNWKLTDYIENTSQTLLADNSGNASFNDTITKGDARLYSILPVVKYGGKLIADETISAPTTLHEDMTIESGATFYVNHSYLAKGNITLKKMINTSERE